MSDSIWSSLAPRELNDGGVSPRGRIHATFSFVPDGLRQSVLSTQGQTEVTAFP